MQIQIYLGLADMSKPINKSSDTFWRIDAAWILDNGSKSRAYFFCNICIYYYCSTAATVCGDNRATFYLGQWMIFRNDFRKLSEMNAYRKGFMQEFM